MVTQEWQRVTWLGTLVLQLGLMSYASRIVIVLCWGRAAAHANRVAILLLKGSVFK